MNDHHLENFEARDRGLRPTLFFGYLSLSLCVGMTLWGAIFSISIVNSSVEPVDLASATLGIEQQINDPMIVARDAELRLIEPAAGPADGCE